MKNVARLDSSRRNADVFGEGAVHFVADRNEVLTNVLQSSLAMGTMPAWDSRADADRVAFLKVGMSAIVNDFAGEFVSENRRVADPGSLTSAENPNIGATDSGSSDAQD